MNKHDLIQQLSLTEHTEGGYFVESYRSAKVLPTNRPGGDRSLLTSIYLDLAQIGVSYQPIKTWY